MITRFVQRARTLARFALIGPGKMRYVHRIRRSGLFDRQYYRDTNTGLHPLFLRFPERHYAVMGEAAGRCPSPEFVPEAYLRHNPDLAAWAARPFLHYLLHGHAEGRRTRDLPPPAGGLTILPPVLRRRAGDPAPQAVAAVVHLYYPDLWPEIARALHGSGLELDLFVTLTHRPGSGTPTHRPRPADGGVAAPPGAAETAPETTPETAPETVPETVPETIPDTVPDTVADIAEDTAARIAARIAADFPGARVIEMPNHGRDIFPFVHLVNSGLLDPYRAVCKIHTKRSPHRQDGDAWRRHLIGGILPGLRSPALLERFLADPAAGLWVADGQHYTDAHWWGSNREGVARLLRRAGVRPDPARLSFAAGSIYWLKPDLLTMIRGLRLDLHDFEVEAAQLDGTAAHAYERVLGYLIAAAGLGIRQTAQLDAPPADTSPASAARPAPDAPRRRAGLVSAFYLPQFHRTPENDAWWGRGFTEWMAAAAARPVYDGHHQPALPGDLGFYDLRDPAVMGEQAALAADAGIDAFCVHHYWFGGRRILEAPLDNLMARPDIAFPFYLCWANESWRRNWDGLTGEVLLEQRYEAGFETALAADALPYLRDPRYLRPDGTRPRFVIYRPEDLPDPAANLARLRAAWRDLGIGEVELGAVRFHVEGAHPVPGQAVDFWIEMPPHGLVDAPAYLWGGPQGNRLGFDPVPGFRGLIYDYDRVIDNSLDPARAAALPANTIAGVMPGWDNTARRGLSAHLAFGAHPPAFRRWLHGLSEHRLATAYRGEVMINAWNEWGEAAVMEPRPPWGRAFLDIVKEWR